MDCNCKSNKEKHSYHFNISEVVDGKVQEVMNFNFGGHHDLAAMVERTNEKGDISDKDTKQSTIRHPSTVSLWIKSNRQIFSTRPPGYA